ncbi:hypothetical protein K0T92_02785 [Paenibacillus oenotherae]|uniref:N-terminal domain of peptidoglycan hydrolase CwlO-containing protein n=1 Tax=Paenibacillus oenotherae TaxID=1435645 RepID=A0ABS7D1D4_9BACL|nr:hypothetical protein [Paenibacillus oenotherae]MBW7473668.1 hypothetical protein [Paenibacillus oenotherae]
MRGRIRRRWAAYAAIALAVWLTVFPVLAVSPGDEEVRTILEKSLSLVELDKEISRIAQQQQILTSRIKQSGDELRRHELRIAAHREDAGRILRSYYTGERDVLLTALLSSRSLADLLASLDYVNVIFSNDHHTLNDYSKQYRELKKSIKGLDDQSRQLAEVDKRLKAQRLRVLALQQDVDNRLGGRSDEDSLRLMIDELTNYWHNVGLYEVKRYFKALASAMREMPGWIQGNKEMLEIDGFNYTLTIEEAQLNAFLREQNELFNNFAFQFKKETVTVTGVRDGLEVTLSGHYTVENEPVNGLRFHVDELIFNGLSLPDTTRQSLEEEFDLGFYPGKIVTFLKTRSVEIEDGKLIVKLSISL